MYRAMEGFFVVGTVGKKLPRSLRSLGLFVWALRAKLIIAERR